MSKNNMNASTNRNRLPMFITIFFVSLSLFIYQTLLTRLFSAVLSYSFVFVVVSFAILGSGLGGILNHKLAVKRGMNNETIYKALTENKVSLNQLIEAIPFNSKPTTDDSPFFYNFNKFVPVQMVFIFSIVLLMCIYIVSEILAKKRIYWANKIFCRIGTCIYVSRNSNNTKDGTILWNSIPGI